MGQEPQRIELHVDEHRRRSAEAYEIRRALYRLIAASQGGGHVYLEEIRQLIERAVGAQDHEAGAYVAFEIVVTFMAMVNLLVDLIVELNGLQRTRILDDLERIIEATIQEAVSDAETTPEG